jgi:heme exporter protein A
MTRLAGLQLGAQALTLARGPRVLFRDLSFDVLSGQMLLLTGANGSGKSSLLRALIGLAPLQSGELTWTPGGASPQKLAPAALRAECLVQGHAAAVKAELTALENLRLCAALDRTPRAPTPDAAALLRALERVGLNRQKDIETRRLSQGQKQRLQLARFALALEGPHRLLWLMDEPSAALDAQGSAVLQELLGSHLMRGGAAIVATHLPMQVRGGVSRSLTLGAAQAETAAAWTH